MTRQRRSPWPPELGPNTPHDRARRVARAWRDLAAKHCPPDQVAQLDDMCRRLGEADWLIPSHGDAEGAWLTRLQVAVRGGVRPHTVSEWTSRGLTARGTGETRTLTRHPDGYHPDEVNDFLRWRDTVIPPGLTQQKGSRACMSARSPLSRPVSSSVPAATVVVVSG